MWMMGLGDDQVKKRQVEYGMNEIPTRRGRVDLELLLNQFKSPLIWLLCASAGATIALGDVRDSTMIFIALLINTVIGFVQEYRVDKSLEALKTSLSPKAEVIRQGKRMVVNATELVPGDILFVSNAHKIAADGILFEDEELETMEAVLTGESATVAKEGWREFKNISDVEATLASLREKFDEVDGTSRVMMGTEVKAGVGKALVVRTGRETAIGKIAGSLKAQKEEKTPLIKKLDKLTMWLAFGVLGVAVLVTVVGLRAGQELRDIVILAVALAVAALPEGLSLSLTVTLANGMQRLTKKGGVVRHLAAAEALGSVNVLCIDKTGTLTEGVMKVTQAVTNLNGEPTDVQLKTMILDAVLCNDLRDPLEIAMNSWANKKIVDLKGDIEISHYERMDSIPFDPQEKVIVTLHHWEDRGLELLVSGAPEVVLSKTNLSSEEKNKWEAKIKELATLGYRLVGFAQKDVQGEKQKAKIDKQEVSSLSWTGLLVYEDPLRLGAKRGISEILKAGVMIKVITGDYKETAAAILMQLGLLKENDDRVLTGVEMMKLTQEELKEKIADIVLFARTTPEQKLRIVEALQSKGLVVGMTGDGVNDAPALKKADIGIVVGESTEVAKETADMVLIQNNLETLVDAIDEGRAILSNFRKVVMYLLADAFTGITVVLGSIFFGWPLPLLASQILWINLASDGFPYLALTLEKRDGNYLKDKPEKYSGQILSGSMMIVMATISILASAMTLAVFGWYVYGLGTSVEMARTVAMAMLGANSLFYVFSVRSLGTPVWNPRTMNWSLVVGVALGWAMLLSAFYVPGVKSLFMTTGISSYGWVLVGMGTAVVIGSVEVVKLVLLNFFKSK